MSLINEMLRDLEKRNAANAQTPFFPQSVYATEAPRRQPFILLWGLLLIAVISGVYWFYPIAKENKIKPVVMAQKPKPKVKINVKPLPPIIFRQIIPVQVVQRTAIVRAIPVISAKAIPAQKPETAPKEERAPTSPADSLYTQALNSASAETALAKLEKALRLNPRHLQARLLMVKTLYRLGRLEKTAQFLDESLAYFPDNLQFINPRAQIFLQGKQPGAALNILKQGSLKNSSNETYLSLLAAAFQQLHDYADAAGVYEQLVHINSELSANWLGLAISYDNLGKTNSAREAYLNALSKNNANPSVISYIKQRLSELQ